MRHASQSGNKGGRAAAGRASGNSLVELLMVVAILLVILAIALPRLVAARRTAQEASAVVFLRNLHAAQEQYYFAHGTYAATFAELDGFLASNGGALAPQPAFPVGLTPLRNSTMPTLAFLLLPAPGMPNGSGYSSSGPKKPEGSDERSGGGGTGSSESQGGGGSNPPSQGGEESGSGGGNPGSGSDDGSNPPQQSGSPSGGKPAGSQGGEWSKADRMTYQGYEFYLLRPNAHTWNCLAMPVRDEHNGHHYFADQTGAIRREFGKPAGAQSPAL